MSYYDKNGRSDCWPERTLGEALEDLEPSAEVLAEDFDADDALEEFWCWVAREYPRDA